MNKLPIITKRYAFKRELTHEALELSFSNGATRTFYRMNQSGSGAVMIVAMFDADTVLLTREYAAGAEAYLLGLPRGRIDPGETALQAADRELKEEVGYGARRLEVLRKIALAPNYMTHEIDVVLARDLYPERLPGDEPEPIDVVPFRLSQIEELALDPTFTEGRALAALLVARAYLQREERGA